MTHDIKLRPHHPHRIKATRCIRGRAQTIHLNQSGKNRNIVPSSFTNLLLEPIIKLA